MKTFLILGATFSFFLFFPPSTHASLVNIQTDGNLMWNVLGLTDGNLADPPEELLVTNAPDGQSIKDEAYLALERQNDTVQLTVVADGEQKTADVTSYGDEIITLEAKQKPQEIHILNTQGKFLIVQDGVAAETQYPIYVDTKDRKVSVSTDTGRQYILVMPSEALLSAIRSNVVTKLNENSTMSLKQGDGGEILYQLEGQKIISLFNLMELPVDVSALVSASTGKIEEVNQPVWLQILGFLFQQKEVA